MRAVLLRGPGPAEALNPTEGPVPDVAVGSVLIPRPDARGERLARGGLDASVGWSG
jgi:hypothetical protein